MVDETNQQEVSNPEQITEDQALDLAEESVFGSDSEDFFASLDQDIPKGKKRVFVYSAPSQSNKGRLWGNIAHEIPQGSYVALYTTKKFPSKMKKDYVEFMEYQDWRYEECFEIVSLSIQGVTLEAPKDRPWELIGVIPQINNNEHNNKRNYNRLVKLNELK